MPEDNNVVTETVKAEEEKSQEVKTERTWTRDEVNKMIATEKRKAVDEALDSYKKQVEAEKTEAQKLAKMDADEKLKYQLEQALNKVNELQAKDNANEIYKQALSIAKEKNINVGLLDLIDFSKENADSVNAKLNNIQEIFNKALENGVNDKLKQPSPKQISNNEQETDPLIEAFLKEYK